MILDHYRPTTTDEQVRLIASELLSPVRDPANDSKKSVYQEFTFDSVIVHATYAREARTKPLKPVRFICNNGPDMLNCDSSAFAAACYINGYLAGRQSAGYC